MSTDIVKINGVNVFPFSSVEELLNYIDQKSGILIAINAGKIHRATDVTREIINNNIGFIDGVGALFAIRKKGCSNGIIIKGCELWLVIIKKYLKKKSFYLIGGTQETIEGTVKKLKSEFQAINIKNYRNGYFDTDDDKKLLIKDIIEKKPDIVFVAMGSPKQEILMQELNDQYPALYQGLGGSFDLYIGKSKRAPQWFVDHHLEGTYRFFNDISYPRLKRYLNDILFVVKVFLNYYK
ncbi:MAG: WecB/TagA/CpsF family glycosyltransferase [Prevotellaceae bacterium]|jgi:UDP-N-acetyl-D-mannosaminouronate:lipid I N-acetyl-D-mannosaminouronosyltransferase|nr:WecB/TagA/CpsF family glycosyltransferase [Prevotellaceae bacterium]